MKKLFALTALACIGLSAIAQDFRVATLTHDGQVTAFSSSAALQQAHNAAVSGDVITLSSGNFSATTITKAITLRGVGMEADTQHNIQPTYITGQLNINIPSSEQESNHLSVEGVYFRDYVYAYAATINKAEFKKCYFYGFNYTNNGRLKECNFIQSKFESFTTYDNSDAFLLGCLVKSARGRNHKYMNCVIDNTSLGTLLSCTFVNSILIERNYNSLDISNNAVSCVGLCTSNSNNNIFRNLIDSSYKFVTSTNQIFSTFGTTYELTDEAKTTYLGNDGTEVGMYGGPMPFDPVVSVPRITKCEVAQKTTADGKLSVNIEVTTPE